MLLPAASATADPTMAPIALLARAEVICKMIQVLFTTNWQHSVDFAILFITQVLRRFITKWLILLFERYSE